MLKNAVFLLLVAAVVQVPSEYIEPKFIEDVIKEQSVTAGPESRIVSGWEAVLGQHPHHANLRMVNAIGEVSSCGGSFVHREWLITAAHCTAQRITLVIRGGLVSLTRPEYIFETTQYWNYPSYDNSQPMVVQPNDIGIVKLGRPFTITRNIKPIRIQSSADAFRDYDAQVLQASGHGRTWTNGLQPENLQWVYLRGVGNQICGLTFGTALITQNSICAQWFNVTSQSTCQGDSGGPLVHVDADGERTLVGVTSFVAGGNFGCHSGLPAGFIRPGPFHSWFKEISGIDFDNLKEEDDTTETLPPQPDDDSEEDISTTPPPQPDDDSEDDENNSSEEDDSNGEDSNSSEEDSSSECSKEDEDLSELLKRLQVKVKVKVNVKQFRRGRNHSKSTFKRKDNKV